MSAVSLTVELSRAEHDLLLDLDDATLQALFATGTAKWSLAGVSFTDVPEEVCVAVGDLLSGDLDGGPEEEA